MPLTQSRTVLEDCKVALAEIRDGVSGREWRIRWVAAVALLRTVGYVLRKVDAATDPLLKSVIDAAWDQLSATKPQPTIFWAFIEEERNNVLKEYRLSAGQGTTVRPGTGPTLYEYAMSSGPYAGRDQRAVLQEAIDWWGSYLAAIEREYAARIGTQPTT